MNKQKLNSILKKHKKWLNYEEDGERADLNGADLNNAKLSYANLGYANLSYVDLSNVNLRGADLSYADLSYADLSYVNLNFAILGSANLCNAKYSILNLLRIDWGDLSDDLTIELMVRDSIFIGKDKMDIWANGGDCPYSNMERDFIFQESQPLWLNNKRKKPKYDDLQLFKKLCKEKDIKISL